MTKRKRQARTWLTTNLIWTIAIPRFFGFSVYISQNRRSWGSLHQIPILRWKTILAFHFYGQSAIRHINCLCVDSRSRHLLYGQDIQVVNCDMTSVPTKPRTGSIVVPKMTESSTNNEQKVNNGEPTNDDWKTERQLVSSLATLQELETMVGYSTCIHTQSTGFQLTKVRSINSAHYSQIVYLSPWSQLSTPG